MKILHLCLGNYFIDGYNYQENMLTRQNRFDGHEVLVIASTETFMNNQAIGYVSPGEYDTPEGVHVVRIPYAKWLPHSVMVKVRKYPNLFKRIEEFMPDVIMGHDVEAGLFGLDVIKFAKKYPKVRFYNDTHTSSINSGTNWVSLHILHRLLYRYISKKCLPYIEKYFYIGEEEKQFSLKNYCIPTNKMEYFPLGGMIFSPQEYLERRTCTRRTLDLKEEHILFVHSGKLRPLQKTKELLSAFYRVKDSRFKLIIIGSIASELEPVLMPLIKADSRVSFLGWKNSEELLDYLCAGDMYLQPGGQTSTVQNAICCQNAVMLSKVNNYIPYFENHQMGVMVQTESDIYDAFLSISENAFLLNKMKQQAFAFATEYLDYKKLAKKIYR